VNTYRGLHAARYDVVYASKPYADEARFVDALLREFGARRGRLLELACGTGRHAHAFGELGWEVVGVDYSPDLLELARANAPGARFELADMRELDLGDARFDAVTCLFDSIGYPQTNDGVVAALAGARRHLAQGGLLACEFLHAPALLRHASPVGVRRWELPGGGELLRVGETRLDPARGVMTVGYDVVELRADGTYERSREEQSNRFFGVEEMRALMALAGLEVERFAPAYRDGGAIDDDTFHVIALAR
jgi:SAM-dependent methyltransferase